MKRIYLDYAAATPVDPAVVRVMAPYWRDKFYNPSAQYLDAKSVHEDVEQARASVARCLGSRTSEVIFTAGGTEANNLAIRGVMEQFPGKNVVISAIEHDAVIEPAKRYHHQILAVNGLGIIDLPSLAKNITDKTVLVSVMYANNEIGTIQPIPQIAKILQFVREERAKKGNELPIYLHVDACQAGAYLDLHVSRLGADLMTINGGKIYGPKQSGVLYVRSGVKLMPQILGGGQENNLRSGTENVANIIGFAKALEMAQAERSTESYRQKNLQKLFVDNLLATFAGAKINGSLKHRLPNNIHVTFPGVDNERLMMQLDENGIQCAVGSACSASSNEPSHVLKAIGLADSEAQSSLRFSIGKYTTQTDIKRTLLTLKNLILVAKGA